MAGKKVTRALAPPSRRALERAHHKTKALVGILRDVAVKNQQEQPSAFHSVRDVATHFRVPVSTVSRVYRTLEQEGLLSRVRGSKTLLQGLHFGRQLKVRAFVGFPASVSRFVTLQGYRTFLIRIRHELRLRGFAAATAFFEPAQKQKAQKQNGSVFESRQFWLDDASAAEIGSLRSCRVKLAWNLQAPRIISSIAETTANDLSR
jgi:hypothetical protein